MFYRFPSYYYYYYLILVFELDHILFLQAACQAIGADLVVIDNAAESAFLQGAIPDTNGKLLFIFVIKRPLSY